ncbi:hypothetical protein Xen7305DRAFT_00012710 [Xenococcus sp. PCC 7305]|uniref:DUF4347 domain-containing protein n=1 Tax=Xenococcus sp. PCC 7305 TaxID=102125 RepID=UPI0002AC1634|nr:DUF4347 domain-containing protein [Xenococcus sp. PCC 7305]ELS01567.1 hypothetical protein Xen7305DRAFT_00012710 [Xenococcus sp. PCC 7305]
MFLTKDDYLNLQKATNDYLTIQRTTILVVIDPAVAASHQIAQDAKAGTEVLLLDQHQDSITQITTTLAAGDYCTLHLIAHGAPNGLRLGGTDLSSETIAQYKQQLLEWGIDEIIIYGCNIVFDQELWVKLHVLTGANITFAA